MKHLTLGWLIAAFLCSTVLKANSYDGKSYSGYREERREDRREEWREDRREERREDRREGRPDRGYGRENSYGRGFSDSEVLREFILNINREIGNYPSRYQIILTDELRYNFRQMELMNQRIDTITVIAKSRNHHTSAAVEVGSDVYASVNVPGNHMDYHSAYGRYFRIEMPVSRGIFLEQDYRLLKIIFSDEVKVEKIIIGTRSPEIRRPIPEPVPAPRPEYRPEPAPVSRPEYRPEAPRIECGPDILKLVLRDAWDFPKGLKPTDHFGCVPPGKSAACVYDRVQECRDVRSGAISVRVIQKSERVLCEHTVAKCLEIY